MRFVNVSSPLLHMPVNIMREAGWLTKPFTVISEHETCSVLKLNYNFNILQLCPILKLNKKSTSIILGNLTLCPQLTELKCWKACISALTIAALSVCTAGTTRSITFICTILLPHSLFGSLRIIFLAVNFAF